jgi:hypothetical protein
MRNTSARVESSGALLRGLAATSEPSVETSAKNRDEPMVRNLPKEKPKPTLLGVSSTDIPLQQEKDWEI